MPQQGGTNKFFETPKKGDVLRAELMQEILQSLVHLSNQGKAGNILFNGNGIFIRGGISQTDISLTTIGAQQQLFLGVTLASHPKDATGEIQLASGGPQGSEQFNGDVVIAYNYFADVGSDKRVIIGKMLNGYALISAECGV